MNKSIDIHIYAMSIKGTTTFAKFKSKSETYEVVL